MIFYYSSIASFAMRLPINGMDRLEETIKRCDRKNGCTGRKPTNMKGFDIGEKTNNTKSSHNCHQDTESNVKKEFYIEN